VEVDGDPRQVDPDSVAGRRLREQLKTESTERRINLQAAPSKVVDWNRWREKTPADWDGKDLVGYWICRYHAVVGREDPEFQVRSLRDRIVGQAVSNARTFLRRHLEEDPRKWKVGVDKILETASSVGYPRSFNYYVTPGNCRPWFDVVDGRVGQRGRVETPSQRADRDGADREGHRRDMEACAERIRRERAARAAEEAHR
jgi:hypothetical protein